MHSPRNQESSNTSSTALHITSNVGDPQKVSPKQRSFKKRKKPESTTTSSTSPKNDRSRSTNRLILQQRRSRHRPSNYSNDPLLSLNFNLNALATEKASDRAKELYHRIGALYHEGYYAVSPDTVSFNSVLKALRDNPKESLTFWEKVLESSENNSNVVFEPNLRSYNQLLWAFANHGLYQEAEEIFRVIQNECELLPDLYTYNTLLLAYAVASSKRSPSPVTSNPMSKRSLKLLDDLAKCEYLKPNLISLNTVLQTLNAKEAYDWVLHRMTQQYNIEPDVFSYTILIQKHTGDIPAMENILEHMPMRPNKFTLTQIIKSYSYAGEPEKAEEWLQCALKGEEEPDAFLFTAVLEGWSRVASRRPKETVKHVLGVLELCRSTLGNMDDRIYSLAIQALGRTREKNACYLAAALLDELPAFNLIVYNAALWAYATSPQPEKHVLASNLFRHMPYHDVPSHHALIACASFIAKGGNRHEAWEIAEDSYRRMMEEDSVSSLTFHYLFLAAEKCNTGRLAKLFDQCCQQGKLNSRLWKSLRRDILPVQIRSLSFDDLPSSWSSNAS